MKQNITIKDLDMLNEKGKEEVWDFYMLKCDHHHRKPLLSIGQMIEFLGENFDEMTHYNGEEPHWSVNNLEFVEDELCDALWRACVEVLNE